MPDKPKHDDRVEAEVPPPDNWVLFNFLVERCVKLISSAVRAPGKDFSALITAAKRGNQVVGLQVDQSNYEKALTITDTLIQMKPLRGAPWLLRTHALFGLGRFPEALAACDKSIEIDPDDPEKWLAKSEILDTLGQKKAARQAEVRFKRLRVENRKQ